jgi:hypothetical protein
LLADTGAGDDSWPYDLLLRDADCISCSGTPPLDTVLLGHAYRGRHPVYLVRVEIPALGYADDLQVVGVAVPPAGFDGIACFHFLNKFTYGNFGSPRQFGLER